MANPFRVWVKQEQRLRTGIMIDIEAMVHSIPWCDGMNLIRKVPDLTLTRTVPEISIQSLCRPLLARG